MKDFFLKLKKNKWKILLIIGLLPFVIAIVGGTYNAIAGVSLLGPEIYYGFEGFFNWIVFYSYLWWPTYIIGIVLIIISILKSKNIKLIQWFKRLCLILLIVILIIALTWIFNAISYNVLK